MEQPTTNQIDFLAERINAQVEAQEKYSQAFIKILETLDSISEQLDTVKEGNGNLLHELIRDLGVMVTDLHHYQESIAALNEKAEATQALLHDFREAFFRDMGFENSQLEIIIDHLNKENPCVANHQCFAVSMAHAETKLTDLLTHLEQAAAAAIEDRAKMLVIEGGVTALVEHKRGFVRLWEKGGMFFLAAMSIIAVAEALIQFGVFHIVWPGSH